MITISSSSQGIQMANIKKHVGKVKSTDKRCVVVFMQLPDSKGHALIIDVEALQPRYEQILLEVVDSQEGQNENDLASAMARRTVQESGRTVLEEFHVQGLMRKEPIENIIMMPRPNAPFPLRDILEQLGKLDETVEPAAPAVNDHADVKYNAFTNNMNAQDEEKRQAMAMNFLMEADMLIEEANKKREQAYAVAPELRPRKAVKAAVAAEPVLAEVPREGNKRGRKTNAQRAAIAAAAAASGNNG
jgi:hypothetical protein